MVSEVLVCRCGHVIRHEGRSQSSALTYSILARAAMVDQFTGMLTEDQ